MWLLINLLLKNCFGEEENYNHRLRNLTTLTKLKYIINRNSNGYDL